MAHHYTTRADSFSNYQTPIAETNVSEVIVELQDQIQDLSLQLSENKNGGQRVLYVALASLLCILIIFGVGVGAYFAWKTDDKTSTRCPKEDLLLFGHINNNNELICYFETPSKLPFDQADQYCRDHYHGLALILNLKEQRMIHSGLSARDNEVFWIGLIKSGDTYVRVNQSLRAQVNPFFFFGNAGKKEDCVFMSEMEADRRWFDAACEKEKKGLCSARYRI